MSIDVLPETQAVPETPSVQVRHAVEHSPAGSRWKLALLVIGLVVIAGSAAVLIPGAVSSRETGPTMTHTITRDDLVVTVTEQGTLESSNNTEIKCKVRGYSTVIWVVEGGAEVKEGDELVRLDTKQIEDAVSLQTTNAHTARATLERSKAQVANATLAVPAYLEGDYRLQLKQLEIALAIAQENLLSSEKMAKYSEKLFKRGYVTELEVEGNALTVTQAKLEVEVCKTEIEVLQKYTKEMQMETLNGNLTASKSKLEADTAGLAMDEGRRDLALEELEQCVMKADRSGLVIYPSAAQWKDTPDITEGATVRKDQVLLLMPDLTKMQVKVGVHESIVDRIKPGLAATITLPDQTLAGEVSSVASVTRPAGWWTGNVVKYDTIIELPPVSGLKPGMSAEVEIILDEYENEVTIPVAAVVETVKGDFCWVKTDKGTQRRAIQLGDTNDSYIVVIDGLQEGEVVVLNPLAFVDEAQKEVLKPLEDAQSSQIHSGKTAATESDAAATESDTTSAEADTTVTEPDAAATEPDTTSTEPASQEAENVD